MQFLFISAILTVTLSSGSTQWVDIYCNDPPDIGLASIVDGNDGEYSLGIIVTYECQYGYTLKGESRTIECVESDIENEGKWTEPHFSCLPQSCGDPGYVYNGRRTGSLFTFPNSISYQCDSGYKLIGIPVRYCQTSGSWSGRLPRCELITCQPPENINNGQVTFDSLEYGSELNFKCNRGFRLNTDEAVFCTSEGQWSNADVECVESACDIPLIPEHGSLQLGDSSGKPRAGSIVIYSCDGERIADGPTTSKCLDNGQWTFPTPKCLEPCSIPYVTEGVIGRYVKEKYYSRTRVFKQVQIGTRIEDDEELFLYCSKGYEASTSRDRQIKVSCSKGKWSFDLHCEPAACRSNPPPADNSEIISLNHVHGSFVSYRCFEDFRKIENETIVCDFGEWKGNLPTCKSTRCSVDKLQFPGLLKGRKSLYRDGEIFEIECERKYQIAKARQLKCEDGHWKGPLPPCVAASCNQPPPSVHLAKAEISSMAHSSVVKYICEDPYMLVEISNVQCLFGEWKGQLPRCEDTRCYLKNLERKLYISTFETPSVTASGSQLNVICEPGYSPINDKPFCAKGKWTKNYAAPCIENSCSVPRLYNGEVTETVLGNTYWSWKSWRYEREVLTQQVPPGKIVSPATSYTLSCKNGYKFQGTSANRKEITCTRGRWLPDPVCLTYGSRHIPVTFPQRTTLPTTPRARIPLRTSSSQATTTTTKITPAPSIPTTTRPSTVPELDYVTEPEEDCSCEYPIDDENLVATADGKRLSFRDRVEDESVVVFRCEYVGFHRFTGPHQMKCENCESWHSAAFPICTEPQRGNTVILLDNKLNVSEEGDLEIRKGQNVTLTCVGMESATYPDWSTPTDNGITVKQERKEREAYDDILFLTHLEIQNADVDKEGQYECATESNTATAVHLSVIDPNLHCPAFQEEEGISVTYERGRAVKSKASFTCTRNGQELVGKSLLTCLRNGEWSDLPPQCEEIRCRKLKETDMLYISYTNDRKIGSLATFHCFSPGRRSGVSYTKCLEKGLWSDPTPSCRSPPCSVDDLFSKLPQNVAPDMDAVMNSTLPYNTSIRLRCTEDYIVIGHPAARCVTNGTWEIPSMQCLSGCPPLQKAPHSKLIITPEKAIYSLGDSVAFSCPPGLGLNTDSQLIMCLKNGWSEDILPECKEYEDYTDYED